MWQYPWCSVHEAGLKAPNPFGLYDVIGNAGEMMLGRWPGRWRPPTMVVDPGPARTVLDGSEWTLLTSGQTSYTCSWRAFGAYLGPCRSVVFHAQWFGLLGFRLVRTTETYPVTSLAAHYVFGSVDDGWSIMECHSKPPESLCIDEEAIEQYDLEEACELLFAQ